MYVTYHVDGTLCLEYTCGEQHSKEQFVFLKKTPAHIAVQTVCEVVIDQRATLSYVVCTHNDNN